MLSDIDGQVEIVESPEGTFIRVINTATYRDEYPIVAGYKAVVKDKALVPVGSTLAEPVKKRVKKGEEAQELEPLVARVSGKVKTEKGQVVILYEEREEREYVVPFSARLLVEHGANVTAGDQLTEGVKNPQDILRILGGEAVQNYLVEEVQRVYRSQGVTINNKHIEIIVRQMLRRVRIDSTGDTTLLPGELVERFTYEDINAKVLAEGGEPATAQAVLLGVTKASLNTDSFLAAASFQETTRVLTEGALQGSVDRMQGLKENVIIGRLIPARLELDLDSLLPPPSQEKSADDLLSLMNPDDQEQATDELEVPADLLAGPPREVEPTL